MGYQRVVANRKGYAVHAAPESIRAVIRRVVEAEKRAHEEYVWLTQLYARRMEQIERGEWPVKEASE